jgi:type IV pilus assembly protein PilY1
MKLIKSRILSALAACITIMLAAPPAMADDSEVFTSSAFANGSLVRPNVLFVIDTSGSMNDEVISYDATFTYTGVCDKDKIYWQDSDGSTPPTDCTTTKKWFKKTDNVCRSAYLSFQNDGWWRGRAMEITSNSRGWEKVTANVNGRGVECQLDAGIHGDADPSVSSGANKYARQGNDGNRSNRWTNNAKDSKLVVWKNEADTISEYTGNYINWFNTVISGEKNGSKIKTRLEIVKQVASDMIGKLNGVNLGIMRYSNNEGKVYEGTAEGGMVAAAMSELTDANRKSLTDTVNGFLGAGNTPLSETLYEAMQYMSGGAPKYGNTSHTDEDHLVPSVNASRKGNASGADYESPMDFSCQNNFIVYLTDGLPTADNSADDDIQNLQDFKTDGFVPAAKGGTDTAGACPDNGPDGTERGRCMVNLARYMQQHDFRDDVDGKQNITTYIIGFGSDVGTSKAFLDNVAAAGGGKAYTQTDAAGLTATLEEIFADVADSADSTFVSPTVAVNAFNRTRNLDTLFVSVFAPAKKLRWPGNVKKYRFIDGKIRGSDAAVDAVDTTTGFFKKEAKDLFNKDTDADGPDVTLGGAASRLEFAKRKIYTYMGVSKDLTDTTNQITASNATVVAQLGMPATPVPTSTDVQNFVDFIYGKDVYDDDGKTATTERKSMADPMRTRPAVGIYGGTETAPQGVVFTTSNDGMLHATDMATGDEDWAFIPPEMLSRQWDYKVNANYAGHKYGLDGDVRLFKYDANGDGIIDTTTDKMWAVFGFGRGGRYYYALDVTLRKTPQFMWMKSKDSTGFGSLGQAWSAPVITRVNVGGTGVQTDPQKFVAIFGGGYSSSQENYSYSTDGIGNAIYMVELSSGKLLWSAGLDTSSANFKSKEMNNAIPSDLTVIDLTGDGYADRMYVGDMGGRIWRFDIWHGQKPDDLVSGGVFASLGAAAITSPTTEDARRFYYAPDVAVVTPRGSAPYLNIAIGSGYRGHPLDDEIRDSFFSVRDYQPFTRRLTASYTTPFVMNDLKNVTDDVNTKVPDGSAGWVLDLNLDGWVGEKVLAESVTANGVIFFPSFTPTGVDKDNPCLRTTLNRTYAVYLDSAKPFGLRDGAKPGDPPRTDDPRDRFNELDQGGIAPGMAIIQTPDNKTLCLEGVEALGRCVNIGDVTRTFWERRQ